MISSLVLLIHSCPRSLQPSCPVNHHCSTDGPIIQGGHTILRAASGQKWPSSPAISGYKLNILRLSEAHHPTLPQQTLSLLTAPAVPQIWTRFAVPVQQNMFSLWTLPRGFLISVGVSCVLSLCPSFTVSNTHTAFLEFMFLFVASFWICVMHLCDIKITFCYNKQ